MLNLTILHLSVTNATCALLFAGPQSYSIAHSNFRNVAAHVLFQPRHFSIRNTRFQGNLKSVVFRAQNDYEQCRGPYGSATSISKCTFSDSNSRIVEIYDNGGKALSISECLFYRCITSDVDIIHFQKTTLNLEKLCFMHCYSKNNNVVFYTYDSDESAAGSVLASHCTVFEDYNEPVVSANSFIQCISGQFKMEFSNFSYIATTRKDTASIFEASPSASNGKSFELSYCLFNHGYGERLMNLNDYSYFWMNNLYFYNNTGFDDCCGLFRIKPIKEKKVRIVYSNFDKNTAPLFEYDLNNAEFEMCVFDISKENVFLSKITDISYNNCKFDSEVPKKSFNINHISECYIDSPVISTTPYSNTATTFSFSNGPGTDKKSLSPYVYLIIIFLIILLVIIIIIVKKNYDKKIRTSNYSSLLSEITFIEPEDPESSSSIDNPFRYKDDYEIIM